jgi:hypothetical protein
VNHPGEGLTAPIPVVRNDDPLGPDKLAEKEWTVDQLLKGWDRMTVARHIDEEPAYERVKAMLVDASATLSAWHAVLLSRADRRHMVLASLEHRQGEDPLKYAEVLTQAIDKLEEAENACNRVHALLTQIRRRLGQALAQ